MAEPAPTPPLAFHRSVRARLLLITLLPMLLILPLLLGLTVANWSRRFDEVLIAKVNGELTIAHQHLAGLLENRGAAIAALGQSALLARTIARGDRSATEDLLNASRQGLGLDFLYLDVNDGEIVASPPVVGSKNNREWPVVEAALSGAQGAVIDLFDPADLARFGPALVERARIPLIPTSEAVPTERRQETRGMMVHAAAPAPGGVLVGGMLLNRNLGFIDQINDLVYPAASLTEGSIGTATLFLEDVRISTNVRLFEDVRALGTRVSAAVRSRVLDEGRVWLDRAFVVNDWYVSAYEPIVDSFGQRVGMLYVGFLEAPFAEARWRTLRQIGLGFVAILLLSIPMLLRWARGIFRPLEQMNATIRQVQAGDLGARTGAQGNGDEIDRVAGHLDHLLDELQERDQSLRGWADELESRVADRTSELEQANHQLEMTTRQLIVSEKLAAIGEITAGVAHEINNPLAVIQGNIDVIHDDLGPRAETLKTEFTLIVEQIQAINILVSKLLQFARPEEFAQSGMGHSPDEVIRDTLPLVQHLLTKAKITVDLDLAAGANVGINQTELQQVLVNLMINAIQAMPQGGRLTIGSRIRERGGKPMVRIRVQDTGVGMEEDVKRRIFDPFFTMKHGAGTGLGLSISRNLISRSGGEILVSSEPGEGATFDVWVPAVAVKVPDQGSL
ncbi:MAG: cache domain-containing protein [Rhodobacteraceae bacterium]|nr:cache domain-containing protein [Paracoccaceae bacterium]MCP5342799.1 cache domain-containing protein [Paracoccaceae bacterium]